MAIEQWNYVGKIKVSAVVSMVYGYLDPRIHLNFYFSVSEESDELWSVYDKDRWINEIANLERPVRSHIVPSPQR